MPPTAEYYHPAFPPSPSPHITYPLPFPTACAKHLTHTLHCSRAYVVVSGSLARGTDALERLTTALGADKVVGVRRGMRPHTQWSEVLEIAREARDARADCLVTLGAGSLTDGAKIVAFALANSAFSVPALSALPADAANPPSEIHPATIPIICIPTSLSGGEYSAFAGGTDDTTNHKHSFQHPSLTPTLVILDPQLSTTTPERVWLSTGIRAVDHCVEGICSGSATAESDADAAAGLRRLVPGLLRCKRNADDTAARLECQLGVVDAMKAVVRRGIPLGASHGIGHQLGPLGVGHGETSCVLLPAVMRYNACTNADRQAKALDVLWGEDEVAAALTGMGVRREAELGHVLDVIIRALGMPRSLADVGVGKDKLDALAEGSLKDRWCKTNPVPLVEKEQVLEILEMAAREESALGPAACE
ncbi:MAG: hypothetical protein M1833_006113 [Piccolia ochrophora]|nr:MAG: hypothetical protein M1833_006113 [Piccolia ochrophora]